MRPAGVCAPGVWDWSIISPHRPDCKHIGGNPAGWLRFQHHDRGEVNLELLTPFDMLTAEQELDQLLGPRLTVNAIWNEAKQRYLPTT